VNEGRSRHELAVTAACAVTALLLFARLALRHVGDSYFLADQVDVLQKFDALLRLQPEGLWGSVMSGSSAHALGPFGAIVFGVPVALGFGIDAIHAFTSLFLVAATALAFWQLARLDTPLAWMWLIVFTSMRMVWWDAAMFWVNTVLLPMGLLLLALFAAILRRPTMTTLTSVLLVLMLALQEHLNALVGVPVLVMSCAAFLYWRRASPLIEAGQSPPSRSIGETSPAWKLAYIALVMVIGLLPYAIAEAQTGFQNTRAMFSHVDAAVHSSSADGRQAALETLVLATDPTGMWPDSTAPAVAVGGGVTLAALLVILYRRRPATGQERVRLDALLWLVLTTVVAVIGQALFYLAMARPLNGLHYAILLAPWYAIPIAALVAALAPRRGPAAWIVSPALGLAAVVLLIVRAPELADRYAERTPWNYRAIVTALDSLCAGHAVDTVEGAGLRNELTPGYDSVLRYLMTRGYTKCRYEPGAPVVIAGDRSGQFDETLELNGRRLTREQVVDPGLARYRAP